MRENRIAAINADMLGRRATPGEHVAWSTPDVMTPDAWRDVLGEDVETYAAANPHIIVWEVAPAAWRAATADELARDLRGEVIYNDAGEPLEVRETLDGLEVLDGTPAECGCIFHETKMRGMWGFYCITEEQPYCNHECPHDDED